MKQLAPPWKQTLENISESQRVFLERIRRQLAQHGERAKASRYADPQACLEGHTSFEKSLPIDEWVRLNRATRSSEDVWTDYHQFDY